MTEVGPVPPRHPELGQCLLWKGYTSKKNPYGYIQVDGRLEGAHRFAFRTFVMPIPEGCDVSHLCDVPRCTNARGGHLAVEPAWLNTGRIPRTRSTTCSRGHLYVPGTYYCRICATAKSRIRRGYEGDPYAPAPHATEAACAHSHPWEPETTRIDARGRRVRLICSRASRRASYARLSGKRVAS